MEFDEILKRLLGKQIEITIVHHIEGRHLRTGGVLKAFDDNTIQMEIEYKDSRFGKKHKGLYVVNRKASSILSVFEEDAK